MEYHAGAYIVIYRLQKLSFTARGLIGISALPHPQITVTIEDGGVFDPPVAQYSSSKTSFAFDGGIGLLYQLTKMPGDKFKRRSFLHQTRILQLIIPRGLTMPDARFMSIISR